MRFTKLGSITFRATTPLGILVCRFRVYCGFFQIALQTQNLYFWNKLKIKGERELVFSSCLTLVVGLNPEGPLPVVPQPCTQYNKMKQPPPFISWEVGAFTLTGTKKQILTWCLWLLMENPEMFFHCIHSL